jgi:hypothetical protein
MKRAPEADPVLQMVDLVLGDLSVRSRMYVGRRSEEGDAETFVIQTGEEGRFRVGLPDLASDESIQRVAADCSAHLAEVLGTPVPLCPRHDHAVVAAVVQGQLRWVCPDGEWRCGLGEYAELAWPQFAVELLAPILARRLERRGIIGVVTIGVRVTEQGVVAEFGIAEVTPDLIQALRDAAAPLGVAFHPEKRRMIRPLSR